MGVPAAARRHPSDYSRVPVRAFLGLLSALLILSLDATGASAQEIRYLYDDLGRLIGVVDPQGNAAEYVYDAVGNILQIRRFTVDPGANVAISLVTPNRGIVGTTVQIFGKGFSATAGQNQVAFNGVAASVSAASTGSLTTQVPSGATTGPITVTTPLGTAISPEPFTVLGLAVVPAQATVIVGKPLRFEATLGGTVTSAVTWRVDGIVGGNASLGTITPEGLYTAPGVPPAGLVAVEAVLTADPTQVAAAQVEVLPLSAGAWATAQLSVSPLRQPPAAANPLPAALVSVSPLHQPPAAANPLPAALVSVSPVPVITGVVPGSGAPGTTVTVTLSGAGLGAATALTVLRNGSADTSVTATNLTPNADGTSLTATLMIDAAAEVGGRILQVTVDGSVSTPLGTGSNAFTVN